MKRFISAIVMAAAATAAVASYLKKLGDQEEPGVEVIDPQQPADEIVQVETEEERELVDKVAEEMAQQSAEQTVAPVVDALQEAVEQAKQDLSELGEELVNAVEGELTADEQPAEEQPLEINADELFGQPDEPVLESIVPEEVTEEVPEETPERVTEIVPEETPEKPLPEPVPETTENPPARTPRTVRPAVAMRALTDDDMKK
ncbi:MAG: hypothetical protein IKX74_05100 [Erysipelotrichaceae bacterium]|nr:hypothetical protein [Erysipelotrichaceae bacterium]